MVCAGQPLLFFSSVSWLPYFLFRLVVFTCYCLAICLSACLSTYIHPPSTFLSCCGVSFFFLQFYTLAVPVPPDSPDDPPAENPFGLPSEYAAVLEERCVGVFCSPLSTLSSVLLYVHRARFSVWDRRCFVPTRGCLTSPLLFSLRILMLSTATELLL